MRFLSRQQTQMNISAPRTRASLEVDLLPCWCGSGRCIVCSRTRRFGIFRCTTCGSYRIDPLHIRSSAESEPAYAAYYEASEMGAIPKGENIAM